MLQNCGLQNGHTQLLVGRARSHKDSVLSDEFPAEEISVSPERGEAEAGETEFPLLETRGLGQINIWTAARKAARETRF